MGSNRKWDRYISRVVVVHNFFIIQLLGILSFGFLQSANAATEIYSDLGSWRVAVGGYTEERFDNPDPVGAGYSINGAYVDGWWRVLEQDAAIRVTLNKPGTSIPSAAFGVIFQTQNFGTWDATAFDLAGNIVAKVFDISGSEGSESAYIGFTSTDGIHSLLLDHKGIGDAAIDNLNISFGSTDGDGISDETDNCINVANRDQLDTDADGLGNACDEDDDNDSIPDEEDTQPLVPFASISLASYEINGENLQLRVNATSEYDIEEIVFNFNGKEYQLTGVFFDVEGLVKWSADIDVSQLPSNTFPIDFVLSDALGRQLSLATSVLLNRKPELDLLQPRSGDVARPFLPLSGLCVDDIDKCVLSIQVKQQGSHEWLTIRSAETGINEYLDLSQFDGKNIELRIFGVDTSGRTSETIRLSIYVEASPHLQRVFRSAQGGEIVDVSASKVLTKTVPKYPRDVDPNRMIMLEDWINGDVLGGPVVLAGSGLLRITPEGVVGNLIPGNLIPGSYDEVAVLYTYKDGDLVAISDSDKRRYLVEVKGDYGLIQNEQSYYGTYHFPSNTINTFSELRRPVTLFGEGKIVSSANDFSGIRITDADGSWNEVQTPGQDSGWLPGSGPPESIGVASVLAEYGKIHYSATGDNFAAFVRLGTYLYEDGAVIVLDPPKLDDEAIAKCGTSSASITAAGYAYTKYSANGSSQIYSVDSTGLETRRTIFSTCSGVDKLNDRGELMFFNNGARYYSPEGVSSTQITNGSLGQTYFENGQWLLAIGSSLFKALPTPQSEVSQLPLSIDTDTDDVADELDNCVAASNLLQVDADKDGFGDACDAFPQNAAESVDTDGDGMGDNADAFPSDPNETQDTDNDGVGDNEDALPSDANETQDTDSDGVGNNTDLDDDDDGLSDADEALNGTDPLKSDTDGDSLTDGQEIELGLNPLDPNDCPEDYCPSSGSSLLLKLIPILIKQGMIQKPSQLTEELL